MENKFKIVICEDEKSIIDVLRMYLENEGFEIISFSDPTICLSYLKENNCHLCIFDIMMPKLTGYELTKRVRMFSNVPILFLSAKTLDSDKIIGLNLGADDYITKPFNPLEVVARVKSLLRRSYQFSQLKKDNILNVGELELDLEKLSLEKNGEKIILTATEFKILRLLMKAPDRIFTKVQINEVINGDKYYDIDDNNIMVHISNLRNKIEDEPNSPRYIKTIRGLGYKIEK